MQLIFSLLLLVAAACAVDYCKICSDHTLCQFKGPNCPRKKFSGADKNAALQAHNEKRSVVALGHEKQGPMPPAANMKKLKWDDELASVAQRWADQCYFDHDACRNVQRFYVGQNIYQSQSMGAGEDNKQLWGGAVQDWYNEVEMVTPDMIRSHVDGDWGHFTQLVWGDTEYLGCGFTAYTDNDGWYTKYYVCNYGPGGNYENEPVYQDGPTCSKCPKGATCDDGLCVV